MLRAILFNRWKNRYYRKNRPRTKAYSDDLRLASFVGFTPVNDPHLVIYVVIDEPGNKPYYGGTWAAPVFKTIAEESLKYLNVAPDIVQNTQEISSAKTDTRL